MRHPFSIAKRRALSVVGLVVGVAAAGLVTPALAVPYAWNTPAPIKTPTAASDNQKTVFFDVTHGATQGNADWVIDGAFSDFADALVAAGYTVVEYRGVDDNDNGVIDFVDDYHHPKNTGRNEARIDYSAIRAGDVFVMAEPNRPLTTAEQAALARFVREGGGLYAIADHYNADRNVNTWDATEVFNGYNRDDDARYNKPAPYGDLRNPGRADTGWLATTFGLRYRFNAIDWKPGASGVDSARQTEGVTQGVAPILMAGGATLAIVDPSRAKGVVYFSNSDSPAAWGPAVDRGLYFGGRAEGPYVAIAKAGAGKAAFIGDSSPIEDSTPRYRREENGATKNTYPGWRDAGNAARLSVNIVNWLATRESYTRFDSAAHPPGQATPSPMADVETTDPDNGFAWRAPAAGYDAWNPATFAYGAYGAPEGPVRADPTATTGCNSNATRVTAARSTPQGQSIQVVGRVLEGVNDPYALRLGDLAGSATIVVKLEAGQREMYSPARNPGIVGQVLEVTGVRDVYAGQASIERVSRITILQCR